MSNPPIRAGKDVIFNIYENSYKHLNEGDILLLYRLNMEQNLQKKIKRVIWQLYSTCYIQVIEYICVKSKGSDIMENIKAYVHSLNPLEQKMVQV